MEPPQVRHNMAATRAQVYAAFDSEDAYAKAKWKHLAGPKYREDSSKPTEEWLIFIRGYYDEAVHLASHTVDSDLKHFLRKLGNLAVQCMLANGVSDRAGTFHEADRVDLSKVRQVIDRARKYRDNDSKALTPRADIRRQRLLPHFILSIGRYLRSAERALDDDNEREALSFVREIAECATYGMELHGAPTRDPYVPE